MLPNLEKSLIFEELPDILIVSGFENFEKFDFYGVTVIKALDFEKTH